MTNTIRIKAIVPETVADDIVYYADDSGIFILIRNQPGAGTRCSRPVCAP